MDCADAPTIPDSVVKVSPAELQSWVLLFQKEGRIELWEGGLITILEVDSFHQLLYKTISPGIYAHVSAIEGFADNDKLRKFQGKRLAVFPEAPGANGVLPACFACRHDVIESYASLNMLWTEIKNKK